MSGNPRILCLPVREALSGPSRRTPVTKAPLVPSFCLHASSKAASSWPNRHRSCCYVWLETAKLARHGANTGLSPSIRRQPFFSASNYRGAHLTAQVSKVAERLLLPTLETHITQLPLDQISSPARKVEVRGTRWPTSQCLGFLRSTDARELLSFIRRNSDAKEFTLP